MTSNTKNILFARRLFLSCESTIVIAIVLGLLKISICNGEGKINSSSLFFSDLTAYDVSDTNLCGTVYPLMDFGLPADNEGKIDTIILRNKKKSYILRVIGATSPHVKIVVFLEREEVNEFGKTLLDYLKKHNISSGRISNIILLPLDS